MEDLSEFIVSLVYIVSSMLAGNTERNFVFKRNNNNENSWWFENESLSPLLQGSCVVYEQTWVAQFWLPSLGAWCARL